MGYIVKDNFLAECGHAKKGEAFSHSDSKLVKRLLKEGLIEEVKEEAPKKPEKKGEKE